MKKKKGGSTLPRKKKGFRLAFKSYWQLYVLVLPAVLYFLVFNYLPLYGIQIAFKDYKAVKGIAGSPWVGLKHFKNFFNAYYFDRLIINTLLLNILNLVFSFPVPLLLSILLNQIRKQKVKRAIQTTIYVPYFISTVVLVAMLQILLSPSTGVVSGLLRKIHFISESTNLLGSPSAFVPVYVISGIWQSAGWNSIIFIAALSSVDGELYDAAKIDGADRWHQMIHLELPALVPTIVILLIMNMGRVLSVGFEKVFLMQNDLNLSVSEVISTYVFNVGVQSGQFSFGSAVGLFNTVINFAFLMLANCVAKKTADISLM